MFGEHLGIERKRLSLRTGSLLYRSIDLPYASRNSAGKTVMPLRNFQMAPGLERRLLGTTPEEKRTLDELFSLTCEQLRRLASTLNELSAVALRNGQLDEAEARFRRMTDVCREVYKDKHHYIGVALSNLAGVYQEKKEYARAEQLFRDGLRRYVETLAADRQLGGLHASGSDESSHCDTAMGQ